MSAAPRPVRSTYWRQVERIAPPRLLDREAELADLAGFCLEKQRSPYVWWRAGPWAGKSALLSTFVLNAPVLLAADQVWLVSFFITARLASQDTREAFTTALTEQLCSLLGLDLPVGGDEATRESALLDLLAQAAAACQQAGGRLILVVDGLDEDRGETTGPAAHSIAGLLPGRPPAGMRVIVASRPNPPIPDDVPDWHPLRDPGIIRLLSDSPHAQNLRRLGQSELKRLLRGTRLEQDLLGLLTAAQGGLSGLDLRELTGADLVTVEQVLHTVVGRTFTRRLPSWAPDDGPQVYLLGHEELHNAARHYLGHDRLAHYRDRLHIWADSYRMPTISGPPWPVQTPEYLMTGYPRLLTTTGDTNRLIALALDSARHDRMLDLSGGDTAALTEIKNCQDLLLDCPEPDLYALARLSYHRSQLESRNAHIPAELPAVWATLGQPNRAEALARALTDPAQQAQALAGVAGAVAAAGDHERAEQLARTIASSAQQARALTDVARALVTAGDPEWARELLIDADQLARTITDPAQQAQALAGVAGAVAAAGDHERAEQLARTITTSAQEAQALAGVAGAVAAAGDHERAEQLARTITDPHLQARALTDVARALVTAGDPEWACELLIDADQLARTITDPAQQAQALAGVAGAVAAAGNQERARELVIDAEQLADTLTDRAQWARALTDIARALVAAGEQERARELVIDPGRRARTITDRAQWARALTDVARALVTAGDPEWACELLIDADQLARTITDPAQQAQALAGVAGAVAAAGNQERARELVIDAEQLARTITDPYQQAWTLVGLAGAVAAAGDHERAERLARTITDPYQQARALAGAAGAVAAAGDHERAERLAHALTDPALQAWALAGVAGAVAAAGDHERAHELVIEADQLARTITDPAQQARALIDMAGAVAAAGDHEQAREFSIDAKEFARTTNRSYLQARALVGMAGAVAAAGDHERAAQLARTITDPYLQARALVGVAKVIGLPQAGHLLGEAFALGPWLTPLPVLAKIQPQEVLRIADAIFQEMPAVR